MVARESLKCEYLHFSLGHCSSRSDYCTRDFFTGICMRLMSGFVRWYGWSAQLHAHWIMPIIGSGIYGFGIYRPPTRIPLLILTTISAGMMTT